MYACTIARSFIYSFLQFSLATISDSNYFSIITTQIQCIREQCNLCAMGIDKPCNTLSTESTDITMFNVYMEFTTFVVVDFFFVFHIARLVLFCFDAIELKRIDACSLVRLHCQITCACISFQV